MTTYAQLVDELAANVHATYVAEKRAQGIESLESRHDTGDLMRPYAELAEVDKEDDRRTVRAVLAALAGRPVVEVLGLLRDLSDELLLSHLREAATVCDPTPDTLTTRISATGDGEDGQR